jgi:hypothetical protein
MTDVIDRPVAATGQSYEVRDVTLFEIAVDHRG